MSGRSIGPDEWPLLSPEQQEDIRQWVELEELGPLEDIVSVEELPDGEVKVVRVVRDANGRMQADRETNEFVKETITRTPKEPLPGGEQ